MNYSQWKRHHRIRAFLWRLPIVRQVLCCFVDRIVADEHGQVWDHSPYFRRVKWVFRLSKMSLVESKRFVDRCYGEKKRIPPMSRPHVSTVYYAHSLQKYGTRTEKAEIRQIRRLLHCKVVNPREAVSNAGGGSKAMADCLKLVRKVPGLVFSEYTGYIGRGVYAEVTLARELGKPVWLLRDRRLYDTFELELLGSDWAIRYAQVIL